MQVEVIDIKPCDHPRIKAIATIQLVGIAKIYGIKILEGDRSSYCVPPNQSYLENGLRKWTSILTFERNIWSQIQEKVLTRYQELNYDNQRKSRNS